MDPVLSVLVGVFFIALGCFFLYLDFKQYSTWFDQKGEYRAISNTKGKHGHGIPFIASAGLIVFGIMVILDAIF